MSQQIWTRGTWGLAVLAIAAMGVAALAQQPQTVDPANPNPTQPGVIQRPGFNQPGLNQGAMVAQRGNLDHEMVRWLTMGNKAEIALARLARQRSTNEQVKQFATQMIDDHTKILNSLEQFATRTGHGAMSRHGLNKSAATERPGVGDQNPVAQPGTTNQFNQPPGNETAGNEPQNARPGRRFGAMAGARDRGHEFIHILHEVAQQCEQSAIRELSEKQGEHFDKAYVGTQIMAHMHFIDEVNVFERYASADLQPILQEGAQIAKDHLQHAKQLMRQLEGNQTKTTAERSSSTSQQ